MKVILTKQAQKDLKEIERNPILLKKVSALLDLLQRNPYEVPPAYEKLQGFGKDKIYSRRINIQHRLVYQVLEEEGIVHVYRLWTHYDGLHPIFGSNIPPLK
jgi:toxin YoeB